MYLQTQLGKLDGAALTGKDLLANPASLEPQVSLPENLPWQWQQAEGLVKIRAGPSARRPPTPQTSDWALPNFSGRLQVATALWNRNSLLPHSLAGERTEQGPFTFLQRQRQHPLQLCSCIRVRPGTGLNRHRLGSGDHSAPRRPAGHHAQWRGAGGGA